MVRVRGDNTEELKSLSLGREIFLRVQLEFIVAKK